MRLLNTTSDQENRERISKRVRNLRQATIALLEHWCNDNELRLALNAWVDGRGLSGRLGPAVPVNE